MRILVLLTACVLFAACSTTPTVTAPSLQPFAVGVRIDVVPPPYLYQRAYQLRPVALMTDGTERSCAGVTWWSSNEDVASVSSANVLRAQHCGESVIVAKCSGAYGSLRVEIVNP